MDRSDRWLLRFNSPVPLITVVHHLLGGSRVQSSDSNALLVWRSDQKVLEFQCVNRDRTLAYQRCLYESADFECMCVHTNPMAASVQHVIPLQPIHRLLDSRRTASVIILSLDAHTCKVAIVNDPGVVPPQTSRFHVDEREWVSIQPVRFTTDFFTFPRSDMLYTPQSAPSSNDNGKAMIVAPRFAASLVCDAELLQHFLRLAVFAREHYATARLIVFANSVELNAIPDRRDPSRAGYSIKYTASPHNKSARAQVRGATATTVGSIDVPLRPFVEWISLLSMATRLEFAFQEARPLFVHFSSAPHRRIASFICSPQPES